MEVTWQEIVKRSLPKGISEKNARDTVFAFYHAFEKNIDYDCNIYIRGIGRFKGKSQGRKKMIKKFNQKKTRYYERTRKRKQRTWQKVKFDSLWPE